MCETPTFPDDGKKDVKNLSNREFRELTDRRISANTAKLFGTMCVVENGVITQHQYAYCDEEGREVATKTRYCADKSFSWKGEVKRAGLYGKQLWPAGSAKTITLVEGECDAMAVVDMNGKWPVVSVQSAGSAVRDVAKDFEYLNSFPTIVVCFDADEAKVDNKGNVFYPGQDAAIKVAGMFPIGKVKVLTLKEHKDPNEYLMKGKGKAFVDEWWKAPTYTPTGLKLGKNMWDEISTPAKYEAIPYPWEGMNDKTYGIRLSELVIVTAETGVGKTQLLREIEHSALTNPEVKEKGYGIGLLKLEETNTDTALGLMSVEASKPLHLPDVRETVSDDELKSYFDATVNSERVVIWDHFGSNDIHEVLAKIRHMHNLGCKYIILDHLSIVVSDQSGDERKQLDEITTKLKTLCMELNIAVIAVIHQNRNGQIRGTAGVEQLANIVIKLHRNKEDPNEWRRNVTEVMIQKNRFCGITGPGVYLHYQPETGRLNELTKEEVAAYLSGESGDEAW